jgi:hypothetical protein
MSGIIHEVSVDGLMLLLAGVFVLGLIVGFIIGFIDANR